jgi:hypothetical protein
VITILWNPSRLTDRGIFILVWCHECKNVKLCYKGSLCRLGKSSSRTILIRMDSVHFFFLPNRLLSIEAIDVYLKCTPFAWS